MLKATIIAALLERPIAVLAGVRERLMAPTLTHVPVLPDFDRFQYCIVTPPLTAKARGWDKLQEAERRLRLYRWAEDLNDPRQPQQRVFLDDCLTAFLLSFEAALQFVGDQLNERKGDPNRSFFATWLGNLEAYDLQVRGLRTLRHFAAHVEIKPAESEIVAIAGRRSGGLSATSVSRRWRLPQLDSHDLARLTSRPLPPNDLQSWNALAARTDVAEILEHGLEQAERILLEAETILS